MMRTFSEQFEEKNKDIIDKYRDEDK